MAKKDVRRHAVAVNLAKGMGPRKAMVEAGYSKQYAHSFSHKVVKSEDVVLALVELGRGATNERLGSLARGRLYQDLTSPPKGDKGAKARLGFIRTGLEVSGQLGGPSELHLHQHNNFPPAAQKMMTEMMLKLAAERGLVVDAKELTDGQGNGNAAEEGNAAEDETDDGGV